MKIIKSTLSGIALLLVFTFAASAQETMMKKVGDATKDVADKTVSGTKTGWRKGKRIGHTIGNRTWNGSKWVASRSWRGGKWVAVKTATGTKWVYRKGKGVFTKSKKRVL